MKPSPLCLLLALLSPAIPGQADTGLELHPVTDNVYALVGELNNRNPQNLGNNANFEFVVTDADVVLIDPGGSYLGAHNIAASIKSVTEQPIVKVNNTGGQDHRWLGNGFFRQQGAEIIASTAAVADQRARSRDQLILLDNLVGQSSIEGTEPAYADRRFDRSHSFELGGTRFEVHHAGQAHTPGDSYVWLPRQKVVFSGDIVYVERKLRIGTQSDSKSWISAFEAMATLEPDYLVPAHGAITTMAQAQKDTLRYLRFLRRAVTDFMDEGGDLSDIVSIDQSTYSYLQNHETLAGRNAQQVFTELEWE